ncbi:MAG: hypothetical protein ACJAV6_000340 [Candidatus Paceibacteria bacterium]|jgi:hypothetical protein
MENEYAVLMVNIFTIIMASGLILGLRYKRRKRKNNTEEHYLLPSGAEISSKINHKKFSRERTPGVITSSDSKYANQDEIYR